VGGGRQERGKNCCADRKGGWDAGGRQNGDDGQIAWVLHNLVARRGRAGFPMIGKLFGETKGTKWETKIEEKKFVRQL
jgi:hypothetical protein